MKDFLEVLEQNFDTFPEKDAVYTEDRIYTYGDISDFSSKVYAYLKRKGVGKEDIVMIKTEKKVDQIISSVGVLKAGAAFLFVPDDQDESVTRYMFDECNARMIIDDVRLRQIFGGRGIDGYEYADLHDIAYVQYTTGSMRRPKGILMERGALSLCCESLCYRGEMLARRDDKVALLSPLAFAAGIIVMTVALANGMTIYDVPGDTINSPVSLKKYFIKNKITTCFMTPAYYRLLDEVNHEMRVIILGGERVRDIKSVNDNVKLYNMYAQSESGFVVALHLIENEDADIPVGRPGMEEINLKVLDENGSPVGVGEAGEICYENPYFRGYIGTEEGTDTTQNDGIFHSGDIGKLLESGEILLTGRKDDMVKVHGLWMNPTEIEGAIKLRFGANWVNVRCITEKTKVYICVYYTGKSEIDVMSAREGLKGLLPEYMLPTHFFHLEKLPVNKNGKVNLRELPLPEMGSSKFRKVSVSKEKSVSEDLEKEVSEIAGHLVDCPEGLMTDTNLISLGMSSLSAISLIGLLEEKYQVHLSLSDIMENPDINHICSHVREGRKKEDSDSIALKGNHRDYFPLTKNQLGVLAECEANKNSIQYNIPAYLAFAKSEISIAELEAKVRKIFKAHSVINTRIFSKKNVPLKDYVPHAEVYQKLTNNPLVIDVRHLDDIFSDEESERAYFQNLVVPYSIFDERLYRIYIAETPEKLYLFIDIHHIITDGFSLKIITDDFNRLLSGDSMEMEKVTFSEYISQGGNFYIEEDKHYLEELMDGVKSFKYPYYSLGLSDNPHRTYEIKKIVPKENVPKFCREKGFTESSYFHAALLLSLYLLTGEKPFIATTYNGRAENAAELMHTFGFFSKSVPVVWKEDENVSTGEIRTEDFVSQIQSQIISTCSHRNVIYSDLKAKSDILMSFQGELGFMYIERHEAVDLQLETPKFPVHVQIRPREKEYQISLIYDISCFTKDDMQLLYDSFLHVVSGLMNTTTLSDIALTEGNVSEYLDSKWGERKDIRSFGSWLGEFEKYVLSTPNHMAVSAENGTFTYKELSDASDKVAAHLLRKNVKKNDFVAVKMPRIREFVAAIVGIHKAGAAYIPIDPSYPDGRIDYILKDSGARVLLTEKEVGEILEGNCEMPCGSMERYEDRNENGCHEGDEAQSTLGDSAYEAGDLAYMIYTSGSTGLPKGVKISHTALINYLLYVRDEVGVNMDSRISCYASFSFDISVEGLFTPLISGGTVCIVPSSVRKDVKALEGYLRDARVTGGCFPTQMGQLLGHDEEMDMDYITLIGEKMTVVPGNCGRVFNAYGPTESTVVVTYYEIEKGKEYSDIPIGYPMYNTAMLVLDPFGNLLPDGAVGELCIAGEQLAEEYHNNPEKTLKAFTTLRQSPDVRIYHTGDLAKYMPDGNLMFLGRRDRQIKRRGFRIEPGEIENAARKMPSINEVSVQVSTGRLILYYTLIEDASDIDSVKRDLVGYLKENLPDYMIPDGFMKLDSMPLTPNGKLDVNKLPKYHFESGRYVEPKNDREREMCRKIAELLQVKKVGTHDDFFELGGNSLDAVQLSVMLGDEYELSDIYNGRTVIGIISEADKKMRVDTLKCQTIYPLTEEQKKFFFTQEVGARPELSYANVPMLFQIPDDTDMQLLQVNLIRIINNHPYLKVRFCENTDEANYPDEWFVALRDDTIPAEVKLFHQDKIDKKTLIKPYNLIGDENLYRISLYELENGEKYIFLDFHHVLYDGQCLMIMIDELKTLMNGGDLTPETVTGYDAALDDYRRKEEKRDEIISFYHDLLKDTDKKLNDWINDRRNVRERLKRLHTFDESKGLATLMGSRIIRDSRSRVDMKYIRKRCEALHITENMFFNAAFACMLGECNGKSEALYANVVKNRDYESLEHTVTMMCKTVPVYLKVTEDRLSDEGFLKQLRKAIADAKMGSLLSYESICDLNKVIVPRITMIFRERPFDEEIVQGCRQIPLGNLESIDTLMVKIYFDREDNLFIRFDTSIDFEVEEIDMMFERLDELISRI